MVEYAPKGSLCINCKDINEVCKYDFKSMMPLTRHGFVDGSPTLVLVKCAHYQPKEKNATE